MHIYLQYIGFYVLFALFVVKAVELFLSEHAARNCGASILSFVLVRKLLSLGEFRFVS